MKITDPTLATRPAIRTVARRVLANAVIGFMVPPEWENYPEISEDDWAVVLARVSELAKRTDVQTEYYKSAYRHLAARAEGSPE